MTGLARQLPQSYQVHDLVSRGHRLHLQEVSDAVAACVVLEEYQLVRRQRAWRAQPSLQARRRLSLFPPEREGCQQRRSKKRNARATSERPRDRHPIEPFQHPSASCTRAVPAARAQAHRTSAHLLRAHATYIPATPPTITHAAQNKRRARSPNFADAVCEMSAALVGSHTV